MAESDTAYAAFRDSLIPQGLNIFGVVAGDRYDELSPPPFQRTTVAPDATSAIVVASGGRDLWAAIGRAPEGGDRHRINKFTQRVIHTAVVEHLPPASLCIWPTEVRDRAFPPIMTLAIASGVGVPSKLALLLNPTYGLWMGLRAVVLTPLNVSPTPALAESGFDPCAECHAPCAAVCHGDAFAGGFYDGTACLRTRIGNRACRRTCDARLACPIGAGQQYAAEQLAHHSRHLLDPKTLVRFGLFTLMQRLRRPR